MAELRKYNAATTILFMLITRDAVDFETGATFAAGDVKISKDGGAFSNIGTLPTNEGMGNYSVPLTAAETSAARIVITIVDSATKVWEDQAVNVETYGNASAQHAFDLDTALTPGTVADQVWDEALSGHQAQGSTGAAVTMAAYLGPHGPGVYIDDGAGNTGTTLGDDGTLENPVSTIAAATTIATAMGVKRFYLINNTAITLAQTYEDYQFVGIGLMNQVDLGSQDVDNTEFENLTLTGTQGGTQYMQADFCRLQAILSAEIIAYACWFTGNVTLRAATNQSFDSCMSAVPGGGTPDLTFPGAGTTKVNFRHYSGGLTVKSAGATDVMSYESDGQLVIDTTCTSLTIHVRGNCSVTDNGTTTALTEDAALTRTAIADKVLNRPISNVEPGAVFRTLYGAIASLVNKREIIAGPKIRTYKADDTTPLQDLDLVEDSGQDPIKSIDPV